MNLQPYINALHTWLSQAGIGATLSSFIMVIAIILCLVVLYFVLSKLIEPLVDIFTRWTEVKWDDVVFRHKAIRWVWALIISLFAYVTLPPALADFKTLQAIATVALRVMLILSLMMNCIESVKSVFLLLGDRNNVDQIVEQMRIAEDNGEEFKYTPSHSLNGLQQMICIIIVGISVILIISTLIGKDPVIIISGLGAMAAVLMLIFQDSILGVVAGVQLTTNDMLRPGDWITAPKYDANGIVQEVTLAAVKVQNFDKTIINIPPYRLLTEGFQNWRGMWLTKGRRVARSINIDMASVRYASQAEAEEWAQAPWWTPSKVGGSVVNLTAFRCYLEHYLASLPTMMPNLLFMVRELAPGPEGLPLQIYFFTSEIEWRSYERVQADVIDQIIAALELFGLRPYQHVSGRVK